MKKKNSTHRERATTNAETHSHTLEHLHCIYKSHFFSFASMEYVHFHTPKRPDFCPNPSVYSTPSMFSHFTITDYHRPILKLFAHLMSPIATPKRHRSKMEKQFKKPRSHCIALHRTNEQHHINMIKRHF